MKNLIILFLLILIASTIWVDYNKSSVDKNQMVNPILGDISYEIKFGHQPNAKTNNTIRIKTHLEYVEKLLRQKDASNLSPESQNKRKHLLDLLQAYYKKGIFPKNYDYANQRKPCFIDKDGTICAVGYLVEQTTSRKVANYINSQYQYDELLAMNDPILDNWISNSGLTKEECAMIQPTYESESVYITPAYGISSSILSGLNVSLTTVNGIQMGKGTTNKTVPIIGLFTGAGQIALGSAMYPNKEMDRLGGSYFGEKRKTLSMVNIGLGTTTMILSAWNLITNQPPQNKLTTWNIYSTPTQNKKFALAVSLTRKF